MKEAFGNSYIETYIDLVKPEKKRIYGVYECSHIISHELSPLLVLGVLACRLNHAKNQRKNASGTQPAREAEGGGFMLVYSNYTDIFYHRSMEKDKLLILDVCGAYGQKDKKKLDRSEINKPCT